MGLGLSDEQYLQPPAKNVNQQGDFVGSVWSLSVFDPPNPA